MKNKHILFAAIMVGALNFTGCADDFLDQKNSSSLGVEGFFDTEESLAAATSTLYNYVWSSFNDKFYYAMGDGRANNITAQYSDYLYPYTNFAETSLSQGLDDAWKSLYSVVAQSNNAINNVKEYAVASISEEAKAKVYAEARFMRGTAYWYIASLWGAGIIYTNTTELGSNYLVSANPGIDLIEFAIRDLEYAAKYLPKTQGDAGRVTCYSAYGMLSRVYLSMAGLTTSGAYNGQNVATDFNRGTRNEYYLDLAKKAALKVIKESGAELLQNYGDLFAVETINNNKESLFQLQFLSGSTDAIGWGANQGMTAFFGWSTMVTDATNWGGATYCSWNLWNEFKNYEDATLEKTVDDPIRRHYSVASYGESYPEMNIENGGYIYGVTEKPGDQGANIKKYVIGTNADNKISYKQSSGINTYMLRLAEVYLNYTEASMGNNSSTTDVFYFNEVRGRVGMPTKDKVTYEDLRHERRVEFAFEGQYWYDLVRRAYYQQQEVINYVNHQQRNASYTYEEETGKYVISDDYTEPGKGVSTATVKNLTLPVSSTDQNKNPNLKPNAEGRLNTVSYTFGEKEVTAEELFN